MPAHTRRFKTIFWFKFQNNVQNTHTALSLSRPKEEEPTVVVTRFFFLSLSGLSLFFFGAKKRKRKKKRVWGFFLFFPAPPSSALSPGHKGRDVRRAKTNDSCYSLRLRDYADPTL